MKTAMLLSVVLVGTAWGPAAMAQGAAKGPAIEFETTTHNFGGIDKGSEAKTVFRFKNTGDNTLTIQNVSTSCGCTSAKPAKTHYQPGESGELPVTFDSSRFNGKISKNITVFTNAKSQPQTLLTISADVVAEILSKPANIFVAKAKPGAVLTREIDIATTRLQKLEISKLKAVPDFLTAELKRVDDQTVKIMVTIDGTKYPAGDTRPRGYVSYETNSKNQTRFRTNVTVNLLSALSVSPNFVLFWSSKAGKQRQVSLKVTSNEGQNFGFESMKSSLEFVKVAMDRDEGGEKRLLVTLSENAPEGQFRGKITLVTDVASQKRMVLPVRGSVIK